MNYGLYISAAGALSSMHRQDVLANNLANLNTIGFKPDSVATRSRLPERLEDAVAIDPQILLEQLGGGVLADPTRTSMAQGDLVRSGNDLDVAIHGRGFFVVHKGGPGSAAQNMRLTRDGRFTLNASGELILAGSGLRVLDTEDNAIRLDRSLPATIDADGSILQGDAIVAQLQLADVSDPAMLTKEGGNLLRIGGAGPELRQPANGELRQGFVESSAVDPILALNDMINASKAVASNGLMMQYHDNLLGQAISTFGRVA